MSRIVRVESVQVPSWSTRAIAWGFDAGDGCHVAFTLSKERAATLFAEMESNGMAVFNVPDLDVLFAKPSEVAR